MAVVLYHDRATQTVLSDLLKTTSSKIFWLILCLNPQVAK